MANDSHVMIEARAGTGKSFSLIEGARRLTGRKGKGVIGSPEQEEIWRVIRQKKQPERIVYVAFSKDMVKDIKPKLPMGLEAQTLHSFGYSACANYFGGTLRHDSEKARDEVMKLMELTTEQFIRNKKLREQCKAVVKLVSIIKMTMQHMNQKFDNFNTIYNTFNISDEIDLNEEMFLMTCEVINRALENKDGRIDYNDMIWLPLALGMPIKKIDCMLVDEAQDLNAAQHALSLKGGKRLIVVGDPRQSIFGFTGADPESFNRFEDKLSDDDRGVMVLPLLASRRCPRAVTELVRSEVPDFSCLPENGEGIVETITKKQFEGIEKREGDMILCRNNAPLVSLAYRLISQGIYCRVAGNDFSTALDRLIETIAGKGNDSMSITQFIGLLSDYYSRRREALVASLSPEEVVNTLDDRTSCLRFLARQDKVSNVGDIKKVLANVFNKEESGGKVPGVHLSSVHRAKGLEADRVFIIRPDLLPHPGISKRGGWHELQENNLWYVACTRSKRELYFVEDDEDSDEPKIDF
jgi:DNA helicase-2/ATP-dependent DNA helicase PcrA